MPECPPVLTSPRAAAVQTANQELCFGQGSSSACSGIRGAAFVLQSRGSSPSSHTGDGICVGGARSLHMTRKALFEMVTPWGKGIEKMDL